MTNNNVLRRLRYALDLPDPVALRCLEQAGLRAEAAQWRAWLKKDGDPEARPCPDAVLGGFLDGLIRLRRGPRPEGPPPPPERLTNNVILKKLRIALGWREDQVLAALAAGGQPLSAGELGALFRRPGHKNYQPCGDQALRAFLTGLASQGVGGSGPERPVDGAEQGPD